MKKRGASPETHLAEWMDKVLEELRRAGGLSGKKPVHDLRTALRRCRSLASSLDLAEGGDTLPEIEKSARKLFRKLGGLRDFHVMSAWLKKFGAGRPSEWQEELARLEKKARKNAARGTGSFDAARWKKLAGKLRTEKKLSGAGPSIYKNLAAAELEKSIVLNTRALRSPGDRPLHRLRISMKRLRYIAENFLPAFYRKWKKDFKEFQDLLGDIHDLFELEQRIRKYRKKKKGPLPLKPERIRKRRDILIRRYKRKATPVNLWNAWKKDLECGPLKIRGGPARR